MEEILCVLQSVEVAAVATSAGDSIRNRMMHYAAGEDLNIYLATMKGDPKTTQITNCPSIALLVHQSGEEINDSQEVEIIGKALIMRDERERQTALEATAQRSPVVKYLVETGNAGMLDCIKVAPETVKFRVFREIVQGQAPTVIEFPEHRRVHSDWELFKAKAKAWSLGLRFSFLSATVVPILLGTAIAWTRTGTMEWGYFLLTLIAALALHAGTNLMNDYVDHLSGNDEGNREFVRPFSGGSRVIQMGLLTPLEVLVGSLLLLTLGSLIGLYLAWTRGVLILALGAVALLSAVFYSGRRLSWANLGLGEAVVGLNFGMLMTLGAYYVQVQAFAWEPVIASIPISFLIAAVLYVNEFPDYSADKAVGKRTLVVRLGRRKAVIRYNALMGVTYLAILTGVVSGILPLAALLGLITLPASLRAIAYLRMHYASPFDLVPANALTIVAHLATGLLLTLAYAWEGFGLQGVGYMVVLGVGFAGFVLYMYRYVERQKDIFMGLKGAIH